MRGALVFIASHSPANANWLGQASREAIAQQVARAVGPSGPNWEYVYRLAAALREVWVQACVGELQMAASSYAACRRTCT